MRSHGLSDRYDSPPLWQHSIALRAGECSVLVVTVQILAGAFAVFFAVVAAAKLDSWGSWSAAVSGWLPAGVPVGLVVVTLPSAEALCAAGLVVSPKAGLLMSAVLLTILGVGVLALGSNAAGKDCGCYGTLAPSRINRSLAARNLLLAGLAWSAFLLARRSMVPGLRAPAVLLLALLGALVVLAAEARRVLGTTSYSHRDEGGAA
jgi:hypothetical protein